MATLTLAPGQSLSVPISAHSGPFVSPSYTISSGSTGTLAFNLDISSADRIDSTKEVSAGIDWVAPSSLWQQECGVTWIGSDYPLHNGKSLYPPNCSVDVSQLVGKLVRVSGHAGNVTSMIPNTINVGATIQVI